MTDINIPKALSSDIRNKFRRAWIEALRSGEYKQGQNKLGRIRGRDIFYCCLGVACEVAVKEGFVDIERTVYYNNVNYDGFSTHLPESVEAALGLNNPVQSLLIDLNDEEGSGFAEIGSSFTEIADYLENLWRMTND